MQIHEYVNYAATAARDYTDKKFQELLDAGISTDNGYVFVDTNLSNTSTNPVQNKAITEALDDINTDMAEKATRTELEALKTRVSSLENLVTGIGNLAGEIANLTIQNEELSKRVEDLEVLVDQLKESIDE